MLIYTQKQNDNSLVNIATHDDSQTGLNVQYGQGVVVLKVNVNFPTIFNEPIGTLQTSDLMIAVSFECEQRIGAKAPPLVREAMTTYITSLPALAIAQGRDLTDNEKADILTGEVIRQWMVGTSGMQATAKSMVQSGEQQFYLDSKWPAWDSSWDAFVARFS